MLRAIFCSHQHAVTQANACFTQLDFKRIHLLGQLGQRHHPLGHEQKGMLRCLRDAFVKQLMNAAVGRSRKRGHSNVMPLVTSAHSACSRRMRSAKSAGLAFQMT